MAAMPDGYAHECHKLRIGLDCNTAPSTFTSFPRMGIFRLPVSIYYTPGILGFQNCRLSMLGRECATTVIIRNTTHETSALYLPNWERPRAKPAAGE